MTCEHKNTDVKESRAPDYINLSNGKQRFKIIGYPCLVVRRRWCNDCGAKFTTVEVLRDYMDNLNAESIRKNIISDMTRFIEQQSSHKEEV